MSASPTQLSLKHLRSQGWYAEVVEHFNSFTKKRHDMFGIFDIVALRDAETLGVQTTGTLPSSPSTRSAAASAAVPSTQESACTHTQRVLSPSCTSRCFMSPPSVGA